MRTYREELARLAKVQDVAMASMAALLLRSHAAAIEREMMRILEEWKLAHEHYPRFIIAATIYAPGGWSFRVWGTDEEEPVVQPASGEAVVRYDTGILNRLEIDE